MHTDAPHYLFEEGQRISLLICVRLHLRSGDHTVKVTCCATGKCLRVLEGHRRTPWVVRFHPSDSSLLASGSLDHQVCCPLLSAHDILQVLVDLWFKLGGIRIDTARQEGGFASCAHMCRQNTGLP